MDEPLLPPGLVAPNSPLVRSAVKAETEHSLGGKHIGFWLSFMFIVNQIYGPGLLVSIPLSFSFSFQISNLLHSHVLLCRIQHTHCAHIQSYTQAIPIVFQQAGWIPTTIALLFFMVVSCLASTMLCEAISCIPNNQQFDERIEFTTAVKHFYGQRWHKIFQVFLNVTVQCYNIASIVICAQSLVCSFFSFCGLLI